MPEQSKSVQLRKVLDEINRQVRIGNPSAPEVAFVAAGNEDKLDLGVIPTGNPAVDAALGGGFARGNVIMIYGQQGVGKSRLCYDAIAYNQRRNPEFFALIAGTEGRGSLLNPLIESGVDLNRVLILDNLHSGESILETIFRFLVDTETRSPRNLLDLVVIDSVAGLLPEAEWRALEKEGLAKDTVGRQAAMLSKFMRYCNGAGALGTTSLVLINQLRIDISGMMGYIIPGGEAIKFHSKAIIELRAPRSERIKEPGPRKGEEIVVGHRVRGEVIKNNTGLADPHTRFYYDVRYRTGVDLIDPLIDLAINHGIIEAGGAGYFSIPGFEGGLKIRGRETLKERVSSDVSLRSYLEDTTCKVTTRNTERAAPTSARIDDALPE